MKNTLNLNAANPFIVILLTFLFGQKLFAQPTITSFSPSAGPVGSTVAINGVNFDPIPVNNIVYFGGSKAAILTASPTSLTVTVPPGTSYQPITVTTNNLTAYSAKKFVVTFPTFNSTLTDVSFAAKKDFVMGSNPGKVLVADFDGDGKEDMVVSNAGSNTISVARNTSTKGEISFDHNITYYTSNGPSGIAIGDLDGDGRLDIAVSIFNAGLAGSVSIFRNTSSTGTVSFAPPINYPTGDGSSGVSVGDLNGDGKPDVVVANGNSYTISILKNTTLSAGSISFAAKQNYSPGKRPDDIKMADFNGDGKIDLVTANLNTNTVSVSKNVSTHDAVAFAEEISFPCGDFPTKVSVGDIDGDGKEDVAVNNYTSNFVSILRNTSTTESISFADRLLIETESNPVSLCLTDFNGDSKVDLAVATQSSANLSLFQNQSITGSVGFASRIDYTLQPSPTSVEAIDFDGDGKPDIAETNLYGVSIVRNKINEPFILSFSPTTAAAADTVTIVGKNFTDATSVKFGRNSAYSFHVLSDSLITAVVKDGVSGSITITNVNGSGELDGFRFAGPPVIASFLPNVAAEGSSVKIKGDNFKGASSVKFGGVEAGSFTIESDTVITAIAGNGATGSITVTTGYGIASLPGFTYLIRPKITSVTPSSGTIGTAVTITGVNFDPNPDNNIVYFGAVRAKISSASTASLVVAVPVGATFQPVTVTRNGFIAYSSQPFYVTFPGSNTFKTTSFDPKTDYGTGNYPRGMTSADFDDDGKADIAVVNGNSSTISVFKNIGTKETISFASKVDYPTGNNAMNITSGDLNGDGMYDLVVANYSSNTVSVFINTSHDHGISFRARIDYPTAENPAGVSIADINSDGKPDIIALNNNSNSVSVLTNTTVNGTISFAPKIDFATGDWPQGVTTGDIDGDGRPDIVVANNNANTISVLRNTSVNYAVSFAIKIDYSTGTSPFNVTVGDLDGNSKPEIVVANSNSNTISVFSNASTPGIMSVTKTDLPTRNIPFYIAIANFNGDVKPDIAVSNFGDFSLSVLNNQTAINGIAFPNKIDLTTGASPRVIAVADYDGDGKPDLAVSNSNSNTISIFRNRIGETQKVDICPNGSTQITSDVTGNSYQWQVDTGNGFSNINDDSSYNGTHSATLALTSIPSSWYPYQYRCLTGNSTSEITSLRFINTWGGSSNGLWENAANWSCGLIPDANTDVVINAGSVMLNSNASCRSLEVNPGAKLTVANGYTLNITK